MHNFFSSVSTRRLEVSDFLKETYFRSLTARANQRDTLPDIDRMIRKIKAGAAKVATATAKARHLQHGIDKIDLVTHDATLRFRSLEMENNVDDPDAYWNYIDKAGHVRSDLAYMIDGLALRREIDSEKANPASEADRPPQEVPARDGACQLPSKECMNVEEIATYLGISISTVYHRAAAGTIPVSRIGARLVFLREEIEAWIKKAS
ncbi:MAG TPA: helix-turn-helix domain-containing protein [Rectinemataceae bacterium]|nr:helix-turn-helix domain-containing protein [Rectinemataceae bacterium]